MANRNSGDSGIGMLVIAILAIAAMPVVGLYFLFREDSSNRGLGVVLLILGIGLWIWWGVN